MFKANESIVDRIIRAAVGIPLIVVGLFVVSGVLGIVLALVGAILTITAAVSWCPIYAALGLSTSKETE